MVRFVFHRAHHRSLYAGSRAPVSYAPAVHVPAAGGGLRIAGRRAGQRFDAERGVTTEALLFLGDLDPEAIGPGIAHATHYEPTPVGEVATLLALVPFDCKTATFVDLGSGMGRALIEAAAAPFRQVVGVEISPALHAIARDNFAALDRRSLACRDVRLVRANAAEYRFPRGPLVIYLFNPFSAVLLVPILERLLAGSRRELALVYNTPVERHAIEARAAFELVGEERFGAVYCRRKHAHERSPAYRRTAGPSASFSPPA